MTSNLLRFRNEVTLSTPNALRWTPPHPISSHSTVGGDEAEQIGPHRLVPLQRARGGRRFTNTSRRRRFLKSSQSSRAGGLGAIVNSRALCFSFIKVFAAVSTAYIGCQVILLKVELEIVDFCEFLSPTPEEQEARTSAVERVSQVIKYIWPRCKVEVFGSFKTGLYLPPSDIDVSCHYEVRQPTPQQGLQALSRALSQMGLAKKIQVIGKARIPIIKFVEKTSGIAFDISFDIESGPKAADFIQDVVSKWPPLRPLCLILKVFLQQRELNEVYSGGLGSYALLTMLMAMLHSHRECQVSSEQNLGVLLVNFFDFYGRKLNTSDLDDDDDPLPRGDDSAGGGSGRSSGKKRKASFKEKSGKKGKENGEWGGGCRKWLKERED
ncbi:non-canonical poly(A) RNA polymerase PAPD5 [Prunus yedoensis var. nudiflora]|uniref:polynucleotide adenylyltransferase n=1 Tax=Prunus yedoensis var. nudiflora TaxID=2094558 RepID=A0A314Y3T3_PRUYE|nr:non-canonical poly(A) RNA polymerase PAPD5 [Prunus yedoensis var. nudiflora]